MRVKKGYVPPEEQQKYDKFKATEPVGVPGADTDGVYVPKPPMSKTAQKNAKRKAKKAETGGDEAPESAPAASIDLSDPAEKAAPAAAPTKAEPAPEAAPASDSGAQSTELEKKLRALRKKLKGVQDLEAKAASGTELNEDQKSKVAAKAEIEAEIARWEGFSNADELSKEVKKLGKKLRQIDELAARKDGGEALNEDQLGKIAARAKAAEELKKLEELQAKLSI